MSPSLDSRSPRRVRRAPGGLLVCVLLVWQAAAPVAHDALAQPGLRDVPSLRLTCERIEFDHDTEIITALRAVDAHSGGVRLTADHVEVRKRSGRMTATGRVHLYDDSSDAWAEQATVDTKTESGTITNGSMFLKRTNTWIRGRLFQRFSEMHYRAKDGAFTNCDADDGHSPDWSFSFEDLDVELGDRIFARNVWLRVRDYPIVPLPVVRYPAPGARQTGLLVPTVGYNDAFGVQYRQAWYWAMSPSQDVTVAPQLLSKRGQGGDVGYRYALNRRSRGQWLFNAFHDADVERARAHVTGAHVQRVNDDLLVHAEVNYATDRTFLRDLSASGTFRALPSQESLLHVTQRLPGGGAYLKAQYLQPLDVGGRDTFQRLPEIGHRYHRVFPAGNMVNLNVGMDSTFVHFAREQGFNVSRVDVAPAVSVEGWHLGHLVGLRPRLMVREVLYSRTLGSPSGDAAMAGNASGAARGRGTVWLGFEAVSHLSRGFAAGTGRRLRHTMTPRLFYEYVPASRQADLPRIDAIDYLPKKHVVTYSMRSRVNDVWSSGTSTTIADVEVAQSYHLGDAPGRAQTWSDVWGRAALAVPATNLPAVFSHVRLNVDAFYDPVDHVFTQVNTGLAARAHRRAYLELGYRRTRDTTVPRRGDIWNPLSFNEVLEAESDIHFFTAAAAVRLPWGWTVGTRSYHDFAMGEVPEWDVVGLFHNACKCWSLGLYYIRLGAGANVPERSQINFVLTLRGVGATLGVGTRVLRSILDPLLSGEPALPWAPR